MQTKLSVFSSDKPVNSNYRESMYVFSVWNQVTNIIYLPEMLQKIWGNIPPDKSLGLEKHLQPILDYFKKEENQENYVLVQGDFGAVHYMVNCLLSFGFTPIYATTERKVFEEKTNNNKVITRRIFNHVCFRKYIQ